MQTRPYSRAQKYFLPKGIIVPPKDVIDFSFMDSAFRKELQDILNAVEPTEKIPQSRRTRDRNYAAKILGQILNNERENYLLRKSPGAILPRDRKLQRDQDIQILSGDCSDDIKRGAFMRFESVVKEYLPTTTYTQLLNHYANDVSKKLSRKKITEALQLKDKNSVLRRNVIAVL